jgi:hypothetical protein
MLLGQRLFPRPIVSATFSCVPDDLAFLFFLSG